MDLMTSVLIPITMFLLMLSMGLTLTTKDFERIIRFPKATIIALMIQLLLLPIVAIVLGLFFDLSTMLAVGLIAAAATPGGTTSNLVVHLGKGDTALSISITALATALTLFTLPLWVGFGLEYFGSDAIKVELPIVKTAAQIGLFTVVPVAIGMWLRGNKPKSVNYEPMLTKLSTLSMVASFVMVILSDAQNNLDGAMGVALPSTLLVFTAMFVGFYIPKAFGVNAKDCATISVETCLKNMLLSLFVATNSLQSIEATYPSVVVITIMIPLAALIMLLYNLTHKQTVATN